MSYVLRKRIRSELAELREGVRLLPSFMQWLWTRAPELGWALDDWVSDFRKKWNLPADEEVEERRRKRKAA